MSIPANHCAIGLRILLAACLIACGCASHRSEAVPSSSSHDAQNSENGPLPGPDAKINISYSRPDDFLSSLIVTQYSAADAVLAETAKDDHASIIRFDGGVVVWQIGVQNSLLADVPMLGTRKSYAVKEVKYGTLPSNFTATIPESGPPQPLETDHYYVFTVTRASGSTSYEAVKVNGDGSLEAYAADPRAGDSFRLCCNVSPDFIINANTTSPTSP
jgi:hypothetical protein